MKHLKTFEHWAGDKAEEEMRRAGEEMMKQAAERKRKEKEESGEDVDDVDNVEDTEDDNTLKNERLSGEIKRRAFDAGVRKYDELPSDSQLHKNKLVSQTKTFSSHINPEIKTLVKNIATRYNFNDSEIEKDVVESEKGIIAVHVYFSKDDRASKFTYDFKLTVFKDSYKYDDNGSKDTYQTNNVEKPKGLDRALLKLVSKIQETEF